jgi:hypothetical protein
MKQYEIHIGQSIEVNCNGVEKRAKQVIIIDENQYLIIKQFADTTIDEDLNTIYKLNNHSFKVLPRISHIEVLKS